MEGTIKFSWYTGYIEMALDTVINLTAAKLKQLLSTATENTEEIKSTISDLITARLDIIKDKKESARLEKLLDVVGGRKESAREKAVKRIIKNSSRDAFNGAFDDAGKQCFTDGYRLVRLSEPLKINESEGKLDTDKCIGDIDRFNHPLVLPDVKELKKAIRLAKKGVDCVPVLGYGKVHIVKKMGKITIAYDFGYGLPLVNALYLVDMLDAIPDCKAYAIKTGAEINLVSMIYFTNGTDDGILMMIRKKVEYEPETKITVENTATEQETTGQETATQTTPKESITDTGEDTTPQETPQEKPQATEITYTDTNAATPQVKTEYIVSAVPLALLLQRRKTPFYSVSPHREYRYSRHKEKRLQANTYRHRDKKKKEYSRSWNIAFVSASPPLTPQTPPQTELIEWSSASQNPPNQNPPQYKKPPPKRYIAPPLETCTSFSKTFYHRITS